MAKRAISAKLMPAIKAGFSPSLSLYVSTLVVNQVIF